ncbi:galactofuranose ABC transporter, permease protein YjfF [Roseateles asaccharophilus]|uniref:Simple sugar transport system permease protein n=1 Tax=Roseateles asaccharophilus TaxID=582607 RepID=A0ABU2ADP0_9BURK|nr:galactofuranose ABC transporter, permease protein YjfF [Roseateles asaccharophilus]MDR7335321.1 simple sugar transport system permease protein [Roseateles asaccharophilus]
MRQNLPSWASLALLVLTLLAGAAAYPGLLSGQVLLNLLIDNAFLLVVAVGMSFVILSGGIDLSVGSVVALTTMLLALGVERAQMSPWLLIPLLLVAGAAFGALMGWVIQAFEVPAFIVTLAGLFLARGLCYVLSVDSIVISDATLTAWSQARWSLGPLGEITPGAVGSLVVLALAAWVARSTGFGRAVYALGGQEHSARLMGLPVRSTRIAVYAVSGGCAALGGVLFGIYTLSGYGLHAQGLELDAIAAVVIGGALLSGGTGQLLGALTGVLMLGLIQTLILFDGTLSSWWTRIVIGALLGLFCGLQRLLVWLPARRRLAS